MPWLGTEGKKDILIDATFLFESQLNESQYTDLKYNIDFHNIRKSIVHHWVLQMITPQEVCSFCILFAYRAIEHGRVKA